MESTSDNKSNYPIASCPLDVPENNNRILILYSDQVVIRTKSRSSSFPLEDIRQISIQKKVILFFAIAGGILTPLALLAAFNNVGSPLLMISLSFVGVMGLYFGLAGQEGISLESKLSHVHFFIYSPHPMLPSFLQLIQNFIKHKNLDNFFRIKFSEIEYDTICESGSLEFKDGKELALPNHQVIAQASDRIAYLSNPYENKMKIEYLFNENNEICPYLYGKIELKNCRFFNDR